MNSNSFADDEYRLSWTGQSPELQASAKGLWGGLGEFKLPLDGRNR